jgi:putative salt-induced outer membrane protein
MKLIRFFVIFLVVMGFITSAYGEEEKEKKWSDEAELSYVRTGGNTDVTTLAFGNVLKYKFTEKFDALWEIRALYGETDGQRNAESYMTKLRGNYLISQKVYTYGQVGWFKDKFAGFDNRYYGGAGAGYKFFDGPKHFLDAELGLNYTFEEYVDNTEDDFPEARAFGKYEFAFNEKNRFSQSLEFLDDLNDSDKYRLISETAVIAQLSTNFALKVSYEIRYNNKPVSSTLENTDTMLSAAIVANF